MLMHHRPRMLTVKRGPPRQHRGHDATQRIQVTALVGPTPLHLLRSQRALSRRGAEPSLWVDIRPDDTTAASLILLVGNSGPTVETDVVVTFDPPLHTAAWVDNYAFRGEERLNAGLSSLPPDRTLRWEMAVLPLAPKLFQGVTPPSYAVTIKANGPFGALEPLTYTIDLGDIENCLKTATGTLFGITRAVHDLASHARGIEEHVAKGLTAVSNRPE
jgi:hypothetical protein